MSGFNNPVNCSPPLPNLFLLAFAVWHRESLSFSKARDYGTFFFGLQVLL